MSYDKLVKGATKTKHAAPKEKYISGLVQATHESDYACSDIAQAIAPRLRDSNSTVVFKALIITHLILRSGNIKNVYSTWSSKPHLLGLNSVTSGHDTAQNLNNYAFYQHTRLKTYASLGRDAIRDRAERRAEGRGDGGEKLRSLTVEKGLLREVAALQKLMDTLLDCKFYLEDREDEVTMSALRLLVKDLLTLFTSVNEGVINVLEHYFEMSHSDATTSLKIYKHFCKETEKVVTYLGIAKKMQNVLNVQVPNLKHAPVSLSSSLEEYLKDANFEANRLEYKQNREIAEGKKPSNPVKKPGEGSSTPAPSTPKPNGASDSASTSAAPKADNNKAFVDFFESIEQEQTSMFDPQTGSPSQTYFQQQAAFNPFLNQGQMPPSFGQQLVPQMTGALAFGQHAQQPQMQMPQMTGMPAFGAFGMSPFGQQQPQMMQPQPSGFLQPQATGINPFRQSIIAPQVTGNPFGQQQQRPTSAGAFSSPQQQQQASSIPSVPQLQPQWTGMNAFQRPNYAAANVASPSSPARQTSNGSNAQPSFANAFGQQQTPAQQQPQQQKAPHPLAPQQTGSKNPFAPPPSSSPPPVPQAPPPSMNQLAFNAFQNFQNAQSQQPPQQNSNAQPAQQNNQAQQNQSNGFGAGSAFGDMFGSSSSQPQQQAKPQISQPTGLMGNLASDFAFGRALSPSNTTGNNASGSGGPSGLPGSTNGNLPSFTGTSTASNSTSTPSFGFSSASSATGTTSQNTGSSFTPSSAFGQQFQNGPQGQGQAPLQPQPTGFGGSSIKPFQPTSSFGASLYADQASKGNSGATTPPVPAMPNQQQQQQPSSAANNNFFGAFGGQDQQQQNNDSTVSNSQNGMGAGATPNPFRMSAMPGNQTGAGSQNAFGGSNNFFGGGVGSQQTNNPSQQTNNNSSPWGSLI